MDTPPSHPVARTPVPPAPFWRRWARRILSVPILVKIMGVFCAVSAIFGVFLYYHINHGAIWRHNLDLLQRKADYLAGMLAVSLAEQIVYCHREEIEAVLPRIMAHHPDIAYVVVRDHLQRTVVTSVAPDAPPGLERAFEDEPPAPRASRLRLVGGRYLCDVRLAVLDGRAGWIQLGLKDDDLRAENAMLTRILAGVFLLASLAGALLSFVLARLITRPITGLLQAVTRVGEGAFGAQCAVASGDEIGALAESFNRMSSRLERYRVDAREQEARLRGLLDKILSLQEDERLLISRELHDEFGPALSALSLLVVREAKDGRLAREACDEINARIQGLIAEARQIAWRMRPSILDDYGLDKALERMVEESGRLSRVRYDFQLVRAPGAARPIPAVETCLYRVAREALTNIERHAAASTASVILRHDPERISLAVEDDGSGFDPGLDHFKEGHLGLLGMKERVGMLGGTIVIESSPGAGTTVVADIPLASRA